MPTASTDAPVISEIVPSGGSITVPSGEVWRVTVSFVNPTNDIITIGGATIANGNQNGQGIHSSFPTVLTGGTTIEDVDGNTSIHLRGFEVSSKLDNSFIDITLLESESVQVPAGETWRVTITTHEQTNSGRGVQIDGSWLIGYPTSNDAFNVWTETIVTEGETIQTTGSYANCHIGGMVI